MTKLPRMNNERFSRHAHLAGLLMLSALVFGCGYPAAEPHNLEVITSLRTALSARNETWLKLNEDKIAARRAAGEMSTATHEAFAAIIAQARGGDWQGAELESLKFQRSQRATPEQIERLPKAR